MYSVMLVEALNRYITAKGYFQAIYMIWQSPDNKSPESTVMTVLPMNMLAAFSLELYFKAWLLQSGKSSNEARAYGHDLNKLYADCKSASLPKLHALDDVVALFSGPHGDFSYRYIEDGAVLQTANWSNVLGVMTRLDTEVDRYVGASASMGLQPGH